MNQTERRLFLIKHLITEQKQYQNIVLPEDEAEQKRLLRFLFNIRMPIPASNAFLMEQDTYLQEETKSKGITEFSNLQPIA